MNSRAAGGPVIALIGSLVVPLQAAALTILLTNDDGIDSKGLVVMARALTAAGHQVQVVAPATQQSGTGSAVTLHGTLALDRRGPNRLAVAGRPADAVLIALTEVFAGAPPDLVISGPNFGQNLGRDVHLSGTVGAALTALRAGIPAIAVSVGLDLAEASAEPRFASTVAAFPSAVAFTVELIAALGRGDGPLLPPGLGLNVNYPATADGAVGAPRWARIGSDSGFEVAYVATADGSGVEPRLAHNPGTPANADADTGWFRRGHITITAIDPDISRDLPDLAARLHDALAADSAAVP